jgi:hypothetical protein
MEAMRYYETSLSVTASKPLKFRSLELREPENTVLRSREAMEGVTGG